MVIERIRLKNFKNFENIDLKLGQMNVFVGANAAGKTNLIQAIKFVRDIQNYGVGNAISLQSGVEYLQNFHTENKKNTIVSIDFSLSKGMFVTDTIFDTSIFNAYKTLNYKIEISMNKHNKYEIENESLTVYSEIREIKNSLLKKPLIEKITQKDKSFLLTKNTYTLNNTKGIITADSGIVGNQLNLKLLNGKEVKLNSKDIYFMPFSYNGIEKIPESTSSFLEHLKYTFPKLSEIGIYDFDIKKMKNPASIAAKAELEENGENLAIVMKRIFEDKKKFTQFSNLIKDILPFINDIDTENSYDKSISLKVKEKYNPDTAIPGSLLSDGTVSITAILTALYFEDKSLAVFEEPEHGVHPSLISKLMESFYDASKNKQIIITTHSPEVLKNTVKEDIFLLLRKDNGDASIVKPHKNKMVKSFLKNDLGIDQLFIQNLLES
jgi:predicted ATPase